MEKKVCETLIYAVQQKFHLSFVGVEVQYSTCLLECRNITVFLSTNLKLQMSLGVDTEVGVVAVLLSLFKNL